MDLGAKAQKNDFEALFKRNFTRTITSTKIEKSADKSLSQPWCSHANTIYIYLQDPAAKGNSLTHAARHQATATTMRSADTEFRYTIELRATASEIAAPKLDGSRRESQKKKILKHFLKGNLQRKITSAKIEKPADKSLPQPWCSHSITIYEIQLQKTIVSRMQPQAKQTWRSHYNPFCSITSQTCTYLRTWQHQMRTTM